jgi:glycosyltransferase involved in cell wall biosynthesis
MNLLKGEKVSIVVPVFNVYDYLPKCVDSLLGQSYKNIEVILVDDGSFDGSESLCDGYAADRRVKVIHKENGGQSSARNLGIQSVTSEWVTFVDSDDYVERDYVEVLLSLVKSCDADISVTSFKFITPRKTVDHGTGEVAVMSGETAIRRMLLDDGFDMGPWAKLYRTAYFDKYTFPEGKLFEDSLATYQVMSEASKVVFKSVGSYRYVNRPNSTVRGRFNTHKLDLIEMTKQAETFISGKYPNLSGEAHRRVVWAYFSTLNQVLNSGAREQVVQRYAPSMVKYLLSQKAFIMRNSFVPKRDKIAYLMLRIFGLKGYQRAWNLYERATK